MTGERRHWYSAADRQSRGRGRRPMSSDDLSLDEARRIALAAQGFDRPRPGGRVDVRHLDRAIRRLGLLQIDSVNVLVRVALSGALLAARSLRSDAPRRAWCTAAARSPSSGPTRRRSCRSSTGTCSGTVEKRTACARTGSRHSWSERPEYAAWVLDEVRSRGPLAAEDLPEREGIDRRIAGDDWTGTVPRAVLEAHFGRGVLAVAGRRPDFSRLVRPGRAADPARASRPRSRRETRRSASCCGWPRGARRRHGRRPGRLLSHAGPRGPPAARRAGRGRRPAPGARSRGGGNPPTGTPEATLPRRIDAASLLSPFDPLVWYRPRVARLFDFEYRLEIYVPGPKRRWGYYVLPFLLGDRLVARVDLKADRTGRRLLVLAAHLEPHARPGPVAAGPGRASSRPGRAGWISTISTSQIGATWPGRSPRPCSPQNVVGRVGRIDALHAIPLHFSHSRSIIPVSKSRRLFLQVGGSAPWRAAPDRPDDDSSLRVQPSHDDAPDRAGRIGEIRQQRAVQPHLDLAIREDLRRPLHQHRRARDDRGPLRPAGLGAAARACACSTWAAASAAPRSTWRGPTEPRSSGSTWPRRWSPSRRSGPSSSGWPSRSPSSWATCSRRDFPEPFDIIWSRDAFMHIPDKPRLFSRLFSLMAPGGRLVITDYARGKKPGSPEFERYIEKTGYSVIEPQQYGKLLEAAGFVDVVVDDATGEVRRDPQVRGRVAWSPIATSSWRRSRRPT